jgi:alkylglycerol monooxygenase
MQGSLHWLEVLAMQAAALAALSAVDLLPGHFLLKPSVMVIAIIFIATQTYFTKASGRFRSFLLLAMAFSLAGDLALLWPDTLFILGLGFFLVAHVFYIAMLRQGQAWFPSRKALVAVLAVGAVMYALIWPGLTDPVLKIAVAMYVSVIALMAAQAIGRATVLGDAGSRWVAMGACIFMVSDSCIAINKFLVPVPLAPLWILATYYTAQLLIAHHARPHHPAD